jgi:predicted anti-sigma-YlaC factor YlaD
MNCEEVMEMLELLVDGEAPTGDSLRTRREAPDDASVGAPDTLEAHLAGCEACRRYNAELHSLDTILDSYEAPKVSKEFASRVSSRTREISSFPIRRWALTSALAAGLLIVIAFGGVFDGSPPVETGSSVETGSGAGPRLLIAAREVTDQQIIEELDLYENADLLEDMDLCADLDVLEDLEESN